MSWIDWDLEPWQADLLATTRFLAGLRSSNPVLGQRSFFTGRRAHLDGVTDLQWFSADGQPMSNRTWDDADNRTLTMLLDGTHVGGQSLLIIFHGGAADAEVTLPAQGDGAAYRLVWDSVWEQPPAPGGGQATPSPCIAPAEEGPVTLTAASVRVYGLVR